MYLSHPVRRMRSEPIPGETAPLVVELGDADREHLEAHLDDTDGHVVESLQFDEVVVSVPESLVAEVCEVDGLARVETADTLGLALEE
jgi:hypothetical protein